jgi:hypothetical protein
LKEHADRISCEISQKKENYVYKHQTKGKRDTERSQTMEGVCFIISVRDHSGPSAGKDNDDDRVNLSRAFILKYVLLIFTSFLYWSQDNSISTATVTRDFPSQFVGQLWYLLSDGYRRRGRALFQGQNCPHLTLLC